MLIPCNSLRTSVMRPGRMYQEVAALAAANDVSTAWVIPQAVVRYLAERRGQGELSLGVGK